MRTRTRDNVETTEYRTKSRASQITSPSGSDPVLGSWTDSSVLYKSLDGESQVTTDQLTIGYAELLRSGKPLPVNPFTSVKTTYMAGGYYSLRTRAQGYNPTAKTWTIYVGEAQGYAREVPSISLANPSVKSGQQLVNEACANVASESWDFSTFALEFRKTVDLVMKAHTRALEYTARVAKAIRRDDPLSIAEQFSRIWLEGRYGWRILFYDLLAASTAVARLLSESFQLGIKRFSSTDSKSLSATSSWSAHRLNGLQVRTVRTKTLSRRGFCGYYADSIPIFQTDPLISAYEVFPFSFVFDMFTNFGSTLHALSPFGVAKRAYSGYTETLVDLSIDEYRQDPALAFSSSLQQRTPFLLSGLPTPSAKLVKSVSRYALPPGLAFEFRFDLSTSQVVDLLSLAAVLYGRRTALLLGYRP